MTTKIIALFGKSGSGKDTIKKLLLDTAPDYFNEMISCTTRPRRPGEIDGKDYYFITKDEFAARMIEDRFLEAQEYNGWFYGSCIDDLDYHRINLGIFTPDGIRCLRDDIVDIPLKHTIVLPIYVRVSNAERLSRIFHRHEKDLIADIDEICRRFKTDEADFSNLDFPYETIYNEAVPMDKLEMLDLISDYCREAFDR